MDRFERVTQAQKNANDLEYYKERALYYVNGSFPQGDDNRWYRDKINFDLYNNRLNIKDLEYVYDRYGKNSGELPAKMANRDICSGKINAINGLDMRRPFNWSVAAVNPEASTRKERVQYEMMMQYVIAQIMDQNPERTPEEIKKYMLRDYRDAAELQAQQILNYLLRKEKIEVKFQKGAKYAAINGREIYWIGEVNGHPTCIPVNPMFFDHDLSPDLDTIEDGEWAVAEYRMMPSEIVGRWSEELEDSDIDLIFQNNHSPSINNGPIWNVWDTTDTGFQQGAISVFHTVWKGLRKIGIVTMVDGSETVVNETYKKSAGEKIEWLWIPQVHEAYVIKARKDIIVGMGPVESQDKDPNNLHECKLPYVGMIYDNTNSSVTSFMDRLRPYQYLYNIIQYRIENLMAHDKGKKVFMNVNAISKAQGMDVKDFLYYLEADSIGFMDPTEEGKKFMGDMGSLVKEIDLSLGSDIQKYVQLAEYVNKMAGEAVGITPQIEGQIAAREAVSNVNTVLNLTSNKLEPYFSKRQELKQNVLQALIDTAKVVYQKNDPGYLQYVLDDQTYGMLRVDSEMLANNSYGIFVTDSSKSERVHRMIEQLSHAAMQTGVVDMSSVIDVSIAESLPQARDILRKAEAEKRDRDMQLQQIQMQHEQGMMELRLQEKQMEQALRTEGRVIEIKEKGRIELMRQALLAAGFAEDKDMNDNQVLDVYEKLEEFLSQKALQTQENTLKQSV
jgi:hypothetical protein